MKTILVSIISDQTIPNLLLIKELEGTYDDQLFIITEYVAQKGLDCWIENAAKIEQGSIKRIKVVEDDLNDIKQNLLSLDTKNIQYIVNMSGGTKVMTIGIYDFFASNNNKIIYVPVGKNAYKQIFPNPSVPDAEIHFRLNLEEYLKVYGLAYTPKLELIKTKEFTTGFFNQFKQKNFNFLKEKQIINSQQLDISIDRVYFSGAWFEEYIYHRLLEDFNLCPEYIGLNVELRRDKNSIYHDNEYDVVFIYENQLFVAECKASVGNANFAKDNLEKFMYKLAAITRDFGLKVSSAIFTLSDIKHCLGGKISGIEKRKNILGIKAIVDSETFLKKENLKKVLI
ncbi:MAG: DUF1887 family CARF protein [Bacteroidales bacterium]|nr:DUF1887 family CARF protein [Bacteroidales bacterium]